MSVIVTAFAVTAFAITAFAYVAYLISEHFKMKHEGSLKQAQQKHASQKNYIAKDTADAKKSKLGLVAIAFLVMAPTPVLIGMLFRQTDKQTHPPTVHHPRLLLLAEVGHGELTPNSARLTSEGSQPSSLERWNEDLPFDADQYPSVEACAAPIARQIANAIIAVEDGAPLARAPREEVRESPRKSVLLQMDLDTSVTLKHPRFVDEFQAAIKTVLPTAIFSSSQMGKDNPLAYVLQFKFKNLKQSTTSFRRGSVELKSGEIICNWDMKREKGAPIQYTETTVPVSFNEKPWLTDFKNFKSNFTNPQFFVGAPSGVEPSKNKAHERAVANVADRLKVRPEQLESSIVDKFTQTIERPYGKVYREAILLDNPIRSVPIEKFAQRRKIKKPSFEFSLAMIACLTVVAGFVSNIATQGYYRTQISRTLAIVISIAVIGIIFLVLLTIG